MKSYFHSYSAGILIPIFASIIPIKEALKQSLSIAID